MSKKKSALVSAFFLSSRTKPLNEQKVMAGITTLSSRKRKKERKKGTTTLQYDKMLNKEVVITLTSYSQSFIMKKMKKRKKIISKVFSTKHF